MHTVYQAVYVHTAHMQEKKHVSSLLPIDSEIIFFIQTHRRAHTQTHTALLVVADGQSEVRARSHCAGVFHSDTLALEGPASLM